MRVFCNLWLTLKITITEITVHTKVVSPSEPSARNLYNYIIWQREREGWGGSLQDIYTSPKHLGGGWRGGERQAGAYVLALKALFIHPVILRQCLTMVPRMA